MSRKVKGFLFHSSQLVENHACNHSEMLIYHVWKTLSCPLNLDTTYSSSAKIAKLPPNQSRVVGRNPWPPTPQPLCPGATKAHCWSPPPCGHGTWAGWRWSSAMPLGNGQPSPRPAWGGRHGRACGGWAVHWESWLGRKAPEKSGEFEATNQET